MRQLSFIIVVAVVNPLSRINRRITRETGLYAGAGVDNNGTKSIGTGRGQLDL